MITVTGTILPTPTKTLKLQNQWFAVVLGLSSETLALLPTKEEADRYVVWRACRNSLETHNYMVVAFKLGDSTL